MKTVLKMLLAALCLATLASPALAQRTPARAYAPDDLRTLAVRDQERVIRLEYEEQSGGQSIPDDQLRFYLDQVNQSNWSFSRIKSDIAQSLGGVGAPSPGGTIRCESSDRRRKTCVTPWRDYSRLVSQLSGASCVENSSWSSRPGEVTVWNGCRAQFSQRWNDPGPGYPGDGSGQAISCESDNGRSRTCQTYWRGPSEVSRQKSGTPCIEGRNWTSREGQVTVWGGCRAEFTGRWNDDADTGYDRTVRCESTDNRARSCDLPWRGASQVIRQLSDTPCTQGYSWEASNGRVTVMRGCRAEFGPAGSDWPGHGRVVTCSSDNGRYTTCHWPPGYGSPRVQQQLSSEACIRDRTWGMQGQNSIWVNQGCRAVFGD